MGKASTALPFFEALTKIDSENANVLNNLASAQLQIGRSDLAIKTWRCALESNPFHLGSNENLARYLLDRNQLEEARLLLEKFDGEECSPKLFGYRISALFQSGARAEAYNLIQSAKPQWLESIETRNAISLMQFQGGDTNFSKSTSIWCRKHKVWSEAFLINRASIVLQSRLSPCNYISGHLLSKLETRVEGTFLLIIHYFLTAEMERLNSVINRLTTATRETITKYNSARAYARMLSLLLQERSINPHRLDTDATLKPNVFLIGDSHCLTLHNEVMSASDSLVNQRFFIASPIIGLKAYHFGTPEPNQYKALLKAKLQKLRQTTIIIFFAGEIDTRLETGIIPASSKLKLDPIRLAAKTATDYVVFLSSLRNMGDKINQSCFFVCNVPCPIRGIDTSLEIDLQRIEVISAFNHALSSECIRQNIRLIDVYTATAGDSGFGIKSKYLDGVHLLPSVLSESIQQSIQAI